MPWSELMLGAGAEMWVDCVGAVMLLLVHVGGVALGGQVGEERGPCAQPC